MQRDPAQVHFPNNAVGGVPGIGGKEPVEPMEAGKSMGNLWEIYGTPMGNLWDTYGKSMGNMVIYGDFMWL